MIYILGLVAVILGVALDQFTKYLAVTQIKEQPIILIDGVLEFRYLENRGAAFGMLQNQQWFFLIITVITLCLIVYTYIKLPREKHFTPLRICMITLTAGAIGNMIDRLGLGFYVNPLTGKGEVIDFIDFCGIWNAIFNGADSFVCVGAGLLILALVIDIIKESKEEKAKKASSGKENDSDGK